MPQSIQRGAAPGTRPTSAGTVVVRDKDTLWGLAQRHLGDGRRWREIEAANQTLLGRTGGFIRPGMALRLPGAEVARPTPAPAPVATPAPAARRPAPVPGTTSPVPAGGRPAAPVSMPGMAGDRFVRSRPLDDQGRWTRETSARFSAFVPGHIARLRQERTEVDCADLAAKLLSDFSKQEQLPNPVDRAGTWHRYDKANPGGLPNVQGPNFFLSRVNADNLAKQFTRPIPDHDLDGIAGADRRTGRVDVDDLEPGDILFYDWDGDGVVNHTVNFVERKEDGTVVLAFGSYDNLSRDGQPLTWSTLDLTPIELLELKPGTADFDQWLGEGSRLWGARRYAFRPSGVADEAPGAVRMSAR
ncbi:MAG: hypothetical protein VKO64_12840 [Candidatus Sericytochromatia bacterium]|nr:hypothetical protein [Candidatus Sericytochromatia bacterium]